jgi:hypothetical protein
VANEAIGTPLYDRMVTVNRDVDRKEPAERKDRNQAESQTRQDERRTGETVQVGRAGKTSGRERRRPMLLSVTRAWMPWTMSSFPSWHSTRWNSAP